MQGFLQRAIAEIKDLLQASNVTEAGEFLAVLLREKIREFPWLLGFKSLYL
ncbi:MAG: hypothetical protein PUP91_30685 [Rhizonema sp. PD37]|nr:hypothetical protein [Rhizonema sp. PD37]